jgi:enoyl-CoA hydratase
MSNASLIIYQRDAERATILLNRPEKRNALSREMMGELTELLGKLAQDDHLRVVILSGVADAFCAGTDIIELASTTNDEAIHLSRRGQELCNQIEWFPVPVIAAINGVAAGGGCELALASHIRIASADASFSLPEGKLGVIPAYGGTQRLAREIGIGRAVDLMLTGRAISASEAFDLGLVNRVVAAKDLAAATIELAKTIESLSPFSIKACLKAVVEGLELPLEQGLELETKLFASLFETEDFREGTSAFLEKRAPVFKGK